MEDLKTKGSRQVCQYQFKKHDIVWICKSCQQDDTCVQCNECFMNADHTGHEVFFYHSQAGGCCDCGDSSSWATVGFCKNHGNISADPLVDVPQDVQLTGSKIMNVVVERIFRFSNAHVEHHNICEKLGENTHEGAIFHIILYNDDVHTFDEVIEALTQEEISNSTRAQEIAEQVHAQGSSDLKQGTFDELYPVARHLSSAGLKIALIDDKSLKERDAVILAVDWICNIAKTSDGLCRLVCNAFSMDHLVNLLSSDPYLDKLLAQSIHNLYLTLMADQTFKLSLARAYALSFNKFTEYYSNGIGVHETYIYSLSVQFLNRPSIVHEIVEKYAFLLSIVDSLTNMLDICQDNMKHSILSNRRYNPILGDLKLLFTIPGISRRFIFACSPKWMNILGKFQYMHRQVRNLGAHVEFEPVKEWMNAFNLYLGLSILFDYLVSWMADPDSAESESLEGSSTLPSVYEFLSQIQVDMFQWQENSKYMLQPSNWIEVPCKSSATTDADVSLSLPPFPKQLSFHICIHRYMANSLREISKYQIHIPALQRMKNDLSKDPLNLCLTIDYPLINVVWASQIKVGMWVRNGQVMRDQLLNYSETPLCRSFRDLDLMLIQFYAMGLESNVFLSHVFARFETFTEDGDDPGLFRSPCTEEALIFVIQLLSELPSVPIAPSRPISDLVKSQLRKEILHRLVSGPKTYSQLQKCLQMIPDFDKCGSNLFDEVIDEVAVVREPSSTLDPPTFSLQQDAWDDYDPTFLHIPANCHQDAFENRPKLKSPKSLVKKLSPAHPEFEDLRVSLLNGALLHDFLREIVYMYAAKRCINNSKYSKSLSENAFSVNDSLYFRVLHLITLMTHTLRADTNIANVTIDAAQGQMPIQHSRIREFFTSNLPVSVEGMNAFEALIDIYETYTDTEENLKMWHLWIFQECNELIHECKAVYELRFATAVKRKNDKKASLEARKKMARERAMKTMKSNASAFASHAKSEIEALDKEDTPESGNLPQCIVCQENSRENFDDSIGYLGLSQVSTVLGYQDDIGEGFLPPPDKSASRTSTSRKDLYFQTCGHAMHLRCFDDYFAAFVHRSDFQQGLVLDTTRGQFQCPLCKRLNNLLLPYCPTVQYALEGPQFVADWLTNHVIADDSEAVAVDRTVDDTMSPAESSYSINPVTNVRMLGNLVKKLKNSLAMRYSSNARTSETANEDTDAGAGDPSSESPTNTYAGTHYYLR